MIYAVVTEVAASKKRTYTNTPPCYFDIKKMGVVGEKVVEVEGGYGDWSCCYCC